MKVLCGLLIKVTRLLDLSMKKGNMLGNGSFFFLFFLFEATLTIIAGKVSVAVCALKMHVVAGQMVNLSGLVSMKHLCLVG